MRISKYSQIFRLLFLQFLFVCSAAAQSTIAWFEVPVGPGTPEGLSVILEDLQGFSYYQRSEVNFSRRAVFSDVPIMTALTLTLEPEYSYDTQIYYGWDNGLYCRSSVQILINFPSIECASYDSGTTPGSNDSCTWTSGQHGAGECHKYDGSFRDNRFVRAWIY